MLQHRKSPIPIRIKCSLGDWVIYDFVSAPLGHYYCPDYCPLQGFAHLPVRKIKGLLFVAKVSTHLMSLSKEFCVKSL